MNLKKTVFIFTSVFFFYSILFMSCKQKNKSSQKLADKAEVQKLEQQMKEQLTLKGVSVSAIQTPKKLPHGIDIFDSAEEIPVSSNVKVHKVKDVVVDNWEGDFYQNEPIFIIANAENKLQNPEEAKADGCTCFIQKKMIIYFPVEYDTVIFSTQIYDGKMAYDCIPFAAYKAKNTIENMNYFYFAVQNPELIHVDLYSSKSGKMYCNKNEADYGFKILNKVSTDTFENIPKNTAWTVNKEGGIEIKNFPYGEKIAELSNQTKVTQINDSQLCFYECIDGKYGYWILVKTDDETSGWIFTGFCQKQ